MNTQKKRITYCADVQSGFSIKKALQHDPNGTHQVIVARHLVEGEPYHFQSEHLLRITPSRSPKTYLLESGNILFMSRGLKNSSTLLQNIPHPAIAPSAFYILRPKENVIPAYLAWIINQHPVQSSISELRTGSGTPMVPKNEFMNILIPLPSFEVQQKIVEMESLMRKEQALLHHLAEKRKDLVTEACLRAVNKG